MRERERECGRDKESERERERETEIERKIERIQTETGREAVCMNRKIKLKRCH